MSHSARAATLLIAFGLSGHAEAIGLGPFQLKGNFQFDSVFVDRGPPPLDDVDDWRRQRLALVGRLPGEGDFKIEYDFASDAFTDAYVRFPLARGKLTAGQFKVPFSAEHLASSSQLVFTENAVAGLFAPGRRLGLQYAQHGEGWGAQGAVYGEDLDEAGPDLGLAARGWWFGDAGGDARWHVAAATTHEALRDSQIRFRMRPEVGRFGPTWLDGGRFLGADHLLRTGLEAGYQVGGLVLSGEWFRASFDAAGGHRSARGGYLQAAWTVHGPGRSYDPSSGLFVGPKGSDGLGQVELAVRYGSARIPRTGGGEAGQRGFSLGANLQYGKHLRFMLDRHLPEQRDGVDAALWSFRIALGF